LLSFFFSFVYHVSLIIRAIFFVFIIYQLNVGLCLPCSTNGTNFTNWSEDDWLETQCLIDTKFIFNRQRYENVILRTRMNEWSLELSYGNRSHLNKLWTELHLFVDRRQHSVSLNNSLQGHVRNRCYSPFISPLTNDSSFNVPELFQMDQRIANYFISDGFFRTINYMQCTIDERRREPAIRIQMDIYLVTNREFQSLLYIEISNETQTFFSNLQARFYLHNHEVKFKYNFNISNIDYSLNSSTSLVHMIKLYNQTLRRTSSSVMISENITVILFNLFIFVYFFHS
jgi:hypothetical protein